MTNRLSVRALSVVAALVAGAVLALPAQAAPAPDNPYQRGPDPTQASITAENGPFSVSSVTIPAGSGQGFNDGTIYYPDDTSEGTFGGIAIMPGFVSPQAAISWYGPRLASQGFVVMTLDSNGLFDFPTDRGKEQLAALNYLATQSPSQVRERLDPNRLAVMGWSMGGGGTLESAASQPSLKAAIPLAPWDLDNVSGQVTVPTMIIGDDSDALAPFGTFAQPFYNGMTSAPDKALIELRNANHFTFTSPNTVIAEYSISWLKRFVDNDTRYDQFLCPTPGTNQDIALFQDTCPLR